MKKRLITALTGVVCLLLGNITKADTVTLYPVRDAYIQSDEPDSIHNGYSLSAGYYFGVITRSYLMFDLSAIPAQSITSTVLRLDTNYHSSTLPVIGAYYLENDGWTESTLTWNNAPTNFNFLPADTQTVNIDDIFWTVSDEVHHSYQDDRIFSVVMKQTNEQFNTRASFWSDETFYKSWSPYIEIGYQPIPEPTTILLLGLGGLILRKRRA